jgi:co-chaperonin GroES (HSP10)
MSVTFVPFGRAFTARILPDEAKSSVIEVVQKFGDSVMRVEVVTCGPDVRDIRPGQTVLVNQMRGQDLDLPGGAVTLLHEDGVLAVID